MSSTVSRKAHVAPELTASSPRAARSKPRPELTPFRALLERPAHPAIATRPAPSMPRAPDVARKELPRPELSRSADERAPMRAEVEVPRLTAVAPEPMPLEPFRVNPALHAAPPSPVSPPRMDDAAFALASELVESMRIGRFGRDGHAVSMRIRGAKGPLDIELREESGSLHLRIEGGTAAEMDALGARVLRELSERGLALDAIDLG